MSFDTDLNLSVESILSDVMAILLNEPEWKWLEGQVEALRLQQEYEERARNHPRMYEFVSDGPIPLEDLDLAPDYGDGLDLY
jgi:hypothetical protein